MSVMRIFQSAFFILLLVVPAIADTLPTVDRSDLSPMRLVSVETEKGKASWAVELAADDEARSVGLMHRESMAFAHGMLFRFDETREITMWMKNTFIPLDMVFMNESGRVTHIHRGAVPQDLTVIGSNGPARFVLEINAGEADKAGIKAGDRFAHPWFTPAN